MVYAASRGPSATPGPARSAQTFGPTLNLKLSHCLKRWPAFTLLLWCTSAQAHGEQYLLAAAALLALGFGAIFGTAATLRAGRTFPSFGHTLTLFLVIGMLVAGVAAKSFEGSALFLAFGGIGGAVPLAVGYFAARTVAELLRKLLVRRAHRDGGA